MSSDDDGEGGYDDDYRCQCYDGGDDDDDDDDKCLVP